MFLSLSCGAPRLPKEDANPIWEVTSELNLQPRWEEGDSPRVLRISSDGDDRIGVKIKKPKEIPRASSTAPKIPWTKT